MKIRILLRATPDRNKYTLETDWKPESLDTPALQRFGFALIKAIEGNAEKSSTTTTTTQEIHAS